MTSSVGGDNVPSPQQRTPPLVISAQVRVPLAIIACTFVRISLVGGDALSVVEPSPS
jgi:hypothetical protein